MSDRECPTCDGRGEVGTGRHEVDTNAPITAECRDCWGTGYDDAIREGRDPEQVRREWGQG